MATWVRPPSARGDVQRAWRRLLRAAVCDHERAEEDADADYDEAVGEVESRPPAEIEEVGHVAQGDGGGEVRDAAADQQPEPRRQHGMTRSGAREERQHPADR